MDDDTTTGDIDPETTSDWDPEILDPIAEAAEVADVAEDEEEIIPEGVPLEEEEEEEEI